MTVGLLATDPGNRRAIPEGATPTVVRLLVLTVLIAVALLVARSALAQGAPPPGPVVYFGSVTVAGAPAVDGLKIVGRIDDYESRPVLTKGGAYDLLTVGGTTYLHLYRYVTFHLLDYNVQATETVFFLGGPTEQALNLTFPALPTPTPTPTATPTVTPTATPTPTPEPTPTPTPTPEPTATPTPTPEPTATPTPTATATAVPPTPTALPTPAPTATATATPPPPTSGPVVITATPTQTATATATQTVEEAAGTCGRSGSGDLALILGGGALLGLVLRRRGAR